jgi:hypothetical protein
MVLQGGLKLSRDVAKDVNFHCATERSAPEDPGTSFPQKQGLNLATYGAGGEVYTLAFTIGGREPLCTNSL